MFRKKTYRKKDLQDKRPTGQKTYKTKEMKDKITTGKKKYKKICKRITPKHLQDKRPMEKRPSG